MENEESKKSETKGKKSEAAEAVLDEGTMEKLILDTTFNKYDAILLARRWAYELKGKEGEVRSLQELISVSIKDILTKRVSHKMVSALPALKTPKKTKGSQQATVLENLQKIGENEPTNGKK